MNFRMFFSFSRVPVIDCNCVIVFDDENKVFRND